MNIVYSSSDSYCEIAGISILSLLEHNRNVKELNLYLIDNNISKINKQKLEGMTASFGRTLTFDCLLCLQKHYLLNYYLMSYYMTMWLTNFLL